MTLDQHILIKQRQFNAAMELYNSRKYSAFGLSVSASNCLLQIVLLSLAFRNSISIFWQIISIAVAYFLADFINGLVHLYMDNNENYDPPAGPLIAAFHLHHKQPLYKKRNIILVYFFETGSKVWLVVFLLASATLAITDLVHPVIIYILVYIGILSSVAEVSHYLCHVQNSKFIQIFRKTGILMNKRHHSMHHTFDNNNYAFLNGMSDPLINMIARIFFKGYKTTTDLHYAKYTGPQTKNR